MLHLIVAALGGGATGSGGAIDAVDWADISFTDAVGGSEANADQTITFTGGGSRQIQLNFVKSRGTLSYSKNGGANTSFTTGTIISVTSGDTLHFTYTCNMGNGSATVTVRDYDLATDLDSFTCTFTYTGGGGPIP